MRLLFCLAIAACSSNSTTGDGGSDAGSDAPVMEAGPNSAKQSGTVTDYSSMAGFDMATVTTSTGAMVVTANGGKYSFTVAKNTPFTFSISGDSHTKLIEQEALLTGDAVRDEQLVPTALQGIVKNSLPGFDPMKAALILGFTKKSSCASSEGLLVATNPPQMGAGVAYFGDIGLPDKNLTYAKDGKRAILYNLDPKAVFTIAIAWASADAGVMTTPCKMTAYPVVDPSTPTVTYTGKFTLEGGDAVSYARVFLE